MHISRTDLNLFVVFEAIYSQGGVTRAAETLSLTQPTISHALSRLRDRVGDPLFVRHGQKLVPTPVAERMIAPVRQALQIIDQTLGELDGFDPRDAEVNFSIGMRSLMEPTFLVPLVLQIREQAPKITVTSSHYDRRTLETDLSSGRVNAAIDVFLPLPDSIRRQHLDSSHSVVVARPGHPAIQGEIDLDTYLAMDHVVVTSRPLGLGPEDQALSRLGRRRDVAIRCQQLNTAMRLVRNSDMILTMAEQLARRANTWFDNQLVAAPFSSPRIDAFLYWHENVDSDPGNQWLRKMVELAAADAPAPGPQT